MRIVLTAQGYFKKLSAQTPRSEEQKLKEGDSVLSVRDASNADSILLLTSKAQLYTARLADFDSSKPSLLGDYLCAKLGMEKGETPVAYALLGAENETVTSAAVAFSDGSAVRYPIADVRQQPKRMKLLPAVKLPPRPVAIALVGDTEDDLLFQTSEERLALISASLIPLSDPTHLNITEMLQMKRGVELSKMTNEIPEEIEDPEHYRKRTLPALAITQK